jgi:tetratricopeptide (TPR) repeat protein
VEAATRGGDDRLLTQAQIGFAYCVLNSGGSCDEAADLATDALEPARRSGDAQLIAAVQSATSYPYSVAGRVQDALEAAETVLELTADRPELNAGFMFESPRGFAFLWRFQTLAALGRTSEALAVMEEADGFLRSCGHKETLSWAAFFRLQTLRTVGAEMGETELEIARGGHEIAETIAGPWGKFLAQIALTIAYLGAGRPAEALEITSRAVRAMETSHGGQFEAAVRPLHSLALTATGDPVRGMAEAELAIRRCVESGDRSFRPSSCAAFATAAAAAGTELDRAIEVLNDGERVVAETGARGLLPALLGARARVHAARGEHNA